MKRRSFIESICIAGGSLATLPVTAAPIWEQSTPVQVSESGKTWQADIVIAGGGVGGCAAAFAALRNGLNVVMTEPTDWIGGQLTQQGVPPDEHDWIEHYGATALYREFRTRVREYYKTHYPLNDKARNAKYFNPGNADVSAISHEPRVALAVLEQMFAPYISTGRMHILKEHHVLRAEVSGKKVRALYARNLRDKSLCKLTGSYVVDATELGELLPLTGTAYVTGTESKTETGELHAPQVADPENNQAFTACFAMDYVPGENWTIPEPEEYRFWKNYTPEMSPAWAGKLLELNYSNPKTLQPKVLGFDPTTGEMDDRLNLWIYRRILDKDNFDPGFYRGDISIVNWPQNDYWLGNIVEAAPDVFQHHFERGKQLSLSLLYWLQTEAPRPDGGKGWPGLRLRQDIMGTEDGLAKYPYVRESRRIRSLFTILEEHVGKKQRMMVSGATGEHVKAREFPDSVGIGYYHIDLHPSTGGDNYIDFDSLRFQIPLGSLIPEQTENLLPACKNIGTTHITNGCYRLHPVEWSIGEAVGVLIPFLLQNKLTPQQLYAKKHKIEEFQKRIEAQGIATRWPEDGSY
ncbi:FAD-dependent oxidoreductase [Sinomicrobium oceani]|uniref:FAD-dependent oxidoreductase n=1 Tax=Sinomicrobium oceani TaxID=1150368 RepID=UPI00227BD89A|nr:FAD-dependent oxidoreductase [Sinomicrobium oceani]